MSDDARDAIGELRGAQAGIRAEVSLMREALATVIARLDALIARDAEGRVSQRRYALTTTIAAGGLVLTALGLIGGLAVAIATSG